MSTERLKHSETCASVFVRSTYDTTCPRCKQINKVILLGRKRVSLGCSSGEEKVAGELRDTLITRFGLVPAECRDRAFEREVRIATGQEERPTWRARRRATPQQKAEQLAKIFGATIRQSGGLRDADIVNDI